MSENTQDRSKLKFDLWERKLLDLSARNTLLNCKLKGKAVPLLVTSCCDVEDCIAQEKDYAIVPRTDAGENEDKTPKIPDIELEFAKISDTAAFTEVLSSAISNGKIYSPLTDSELEGRMKDLYRSSRTAMEEDGAGTLFLACGFLKWIGDEKKETYYAPLILIPVDLVRKFGVGKYVMRKNDEDVRMNVTILEKLRQDFDIIIPELEGELPADSNGVDVKGVIETVKGSVSAKAGWEVVDACVLGMFSFSQFVMWNDMHSHREEIASNKIVKSLLEGKLAWDYEDMEKKAPKTVAQPQPRYSNNVAPNTATAAPTTSTPRNVNPNAGYEYIAPTAKSKADEPWSRASFFIHAGILDAGLGLKLRLSRQNGVYITADARWLSFNNKSFMHVPLMFYLGGNHVHFITGLSILAWSSNESSDNYQFPIGLNVDIGKHFGIDGLFFAPSKSSHSVSLALDFRIIF